MAPSCARPIAGRPGSAPTCRLRWAATRTAAPTANDWRSIPNRPNVLFFGSRKNGLWKSSDEGVTWKKVDTFPLSEEPTGVGITFVLFDPKSGAAGKPTPTIYAGVAKTDGSIYQSTDEGATWKLVPKQPTKVMASHAGFDSNGVLYVSYGNLPGPSDVIDGAVVELRPQEGKLTNITPIAPSSADKFGYGGLSVDASHPGTLMVTTIDRWTKGDEIFRTSDGGKSWKALAAKVVRDDAAPNISTGAATNRAPPAGWATSTSIRSPRAT